MNAIEVRIPNDPDKIYYYCFTLETPSGTEYRGRVLFYTNDYVADYGVIEWDDRKPRRNKLPEYEEAIRQVITAKVLKSLPIVANLTRIAMTEGAEAAKKIMKTMTEADKGGQEA